MLTAVSFKSVSDWVDQVKKWAWRVMQRVLGLPGLNDSIAVTLLILLGALAAGLILLHQVSADGGTHHSLLNTVIKPSPSSESSAPAEDLRIRRGQPALLLPI